MSLAGRVSKINGNNQSEIPGDKGLTKSAVNFNKFLFFNMNKKRRVMWILCFAWYSVLTSLIYGIWTKSGLMTLMCLVQSIISILLIINHWSNHQLTSKNFFIVPFIMLLGLIFVLSFLVLVGL
ncbi:hypothetical protein RT41_GL001130 [Lactococcus fujiensis JCM 16395]|uniref:Uncharacterized protein n=1 Tax=Lactococcus fujiensis JCM 16395 TaxID=1291764 RepID=A0A2A5RN64_9LACT|nr:hypothetical protein RT41_GL001130 [Lactococcus fujiensis JCM 16395]